MRGKKEQLASIGGKYVQSLWNEYEESSDMKIFLQFDPVIPLLKIYQKK